MTTTEFDYRNYVRYDPNMPADVRAKIDTAMQQIASTPEGRAMLEEAYRENNGKPILITADTKKGSGMDNVRGADGERNYTININVHEIGANQYKGKDGEYHNMNITSVLVHELVHAKNFNEEDRDVRVGELLTEMYKRTFPGKDVPATTDEARAQLKAELGDRYESVKDEVATDILIEKRTVNESRVVEETNAFMYKYYGEEPRGDYWDSRLLPVTGPALIYSHIHSSQADKLSPPAPGYPPGGYPIEENSGRQYANIGNPGIRYNPDGKTAGDLSTMTAELREFVARNGGSRTV
jgi:hypothetical protein